MTNTRRSVNCKSWRSRWEHLNTLYRYPDDIRKAIYTTNAIESLNSVIRKAIKKRKLFPTDDAAKKVVYLQRLYNTHYSQST